MDIGSGIAFGLVAALCWGVADFCARGSSRTGGTFLTLFYVEIIATFGLLLLALPQAYTGTANVPSENTGSITLGGMLYAKNAILNLQGNASNNGCFGFTVWTAQLSGTAAFSTCSTLQGTALGMTLVQ